MLQVVEPVGYLGCKENRTAVTLVPYTYFTSHFLGNLSGNVLVVISLDIKVNVYHGISIYDFIRIRFP